MNMNHQQKIACLAGDGVGPELMAEATRALARVSQLHSLALDERAPAVRGRGGDALRPSAAALDARGISQRRRDPRRHAARAGARRREGRPRSRRGASRACTCATRGDVARRSAPVGSGPHEQRDRARVLQRRGKRGRLDRGRLLARRGARSSTPSMRAGAGCVVEHRTPRRGARPPARGASATST